MSATQHLIQKFGSIVALSRATGIPATTISGWRRGDGKRAVPLHHVKAIVAAARRLNIPLTLDEVLPEISSLSVEECVTGREVAS